MNTKGRHNTVLLISGAGGFEAFLIKAAALTLQVCKLTSILKYSLNVKFGVKDGSLIIYQGGCYSCVARVSRSKPHTSHPYEKITVPMYVCMYVCMYVGVWNIIGICAH